MVGNDNVEDAMKRELNDGWMSRRLPLLAGAWAVLLLVGAQGCDFTAAPMPPPDAVSPDDFPVGPDNPDRLPPEGGPDDELSSGDLEPFVSPPVPLPVFERVAFDPAGHFALAQVATANGRCLAVADLDTGLVAHDGTLCGVRWVTVGTAGRAYLLTADGHTVVELALATLAHERSFTFSSEFRVLDLSPDQDALVASNRPVSPFDLAQYEWRVTEMPLRQLGVVDLTSDTVHEHLFPFALRSVAFSPEDGAVLVGAGWWQETGLPQSRIYWMNPVSGQVEDDVAFSNCPADLQVAPGGGLLLTSPTVCFLHPVTLAPPPVQEVPTDDWEDDWQDWEDDEEWEEWEADPTSVIDLTTREFIGTVPGFGPVALSPDGQTAVAFSRQDALMKQWNIFQTMAHGLIVIRLADLYWKFLEHGEAQPDFAFAPGNSAEVLIHDRQGGVDRLQKLSLDDEAVGALVGPSAALEEHSFAQAGAVLYSVTGGEVRRIDLASEAIMTVATDFVARQVFARPQNDLVVVTDAAAPVLHLLSAADGTQVDSIVF
jgi:hypothetical protein